MSNNQPKLVKVTNGVETPLYKEIVAGRQADCDLVLTEGHASRKHAKFSLADGAVWLEDLSSANGTFVNGTRITGKVKLNSGDRLRFDVEEFDFRIPAAAVAADEGKTMYREPDSAVVAAESSGMYKRPGAWADPDAMGGDGANKTKFIDPAQMKQMMNAPATTPVNTASIDGPHLHVVSGSRAGLNIKLTIGESGVKEWTIGSQPDREVQFQDSGVSALHAKIVNEGERWKVLDQMSANGTFVNGKRSNVSYLSSGDRVRFGPVECVFQTSRGGGGSRRSSGGGEEAAGKSKTIVIAAIAFVATIVVLYLVYKFVL
jgi:pSer/pThr/pTyr-binding forkhead associated (FHA) protein